MDHIQNMDKELGNFYLKLTPLKIANTPEGKQKAIWELMKNYQVKPDSLNYNRRE